MTFSPVRIRPQWGYGVLSEISLARIVKMSDSTLPTSGRDSGNQGKESRTNSPATPGILRYGIANERRSRRRALISAPIRVRALEITSGGPDEISSTIDVSRAGILFLTTSAGYTRGMKVKVVFPYSKAPGELQAEQDGRVARVVEMPDGRRAVAIALGTIGIGEDLVDAAGRRLNGPVFDGNRTDEGGQGRKPLVLVVDEDPAVRESLKSYLVDDGYEVIAVNNASDGREVLNLFTPALVIAEIEGENLPGYALCAHVKGTPRLQNVPVVLTTASAYPSDYAGAHSLGAVVCMAKPYRQQRIGHIARLLAPLPKVGTRVARTLGRNG
jgi:CheY-like chemotaxis protein